MDVCACASETRGDEEGAGSQALSLLSTVMKDKELKLVEVEASHTLGGAGKGRVQGRGKRAAYEVASLISPSRCSRGSRT